MKKAVFLICLLSILVNIFGSDPLRPNKIATSDKSSMGLSIFRVAPDVDFPYPLWGYSINGSMGYSTIANSNLEGTMAPKGGLGYSIGASYYHSLGPYFALFAGLDLSSISAKIETENSFVTDYDATDIDGTSYTENIQVNSYEKTSPLYITAPILIEIRNPNIARIGFYFDIGIRFSYLLSSGYEKNGAYTTMGMYIFDGYNNDIILENVPELGFYGDKRGENGPGGAEFNPTSELSKTNISIQGGLGITIPISSTVIFKGGVVTHIGLTDISNPPSEPGSDFEINEYNKAITNDVANKRAKYIDNSFAVNEGSRSQYYGIEFGIYIIRRLN